MKKKKRFQRHFRKFRNAQTTGHPQYVYGENDKKYKVIGITKAPQTNGIPNIPLSGNPEPHNASPAFIRPKPKTIDKGVENTRLKGWKFNNHDKMIVQSVIDSEKKKKTNKKT